MKPHPLLIVALVGALLGLTFAGVSTFDFAQHLDRQVHSVHCSFIPGMEAEAAGGSDCEVTLMSPYSSVLRTWIWGGIPISLPAMSIFAFLLFFGLDLLVGRRQLDRRSTGFFALATAVPAITSVVMAAIALGELDAACKLCIGIYISSALCLVGALGLWIRALKTPPSAASSGSDIFAMDEDPAWATAADTSSDTAAPADVTDSLELFASARRPSPGGSASWLYLAGAFALGWAFVALPVLVYAGAAPDHSRFIGTCGSLDEEPEAKLLVPLGPQTGAPTLEVFDPLCPACRAFEGHLAETRFHDRLARKAVLFPLDAECNWMLSQSVHPGACAISEAVICADGQAEEVVSWAFENQESILEAAKADPQAAAEMAKQRFPGLADCIGSPKARQQLNRSLRWAVDNELRVLTPQIYIDGVQLCDEDVDLGMEFALDQMLQRHDRGVLRANARSPEEDR